MSETLTVNLDVDGVLADTAWLAQRLFEVIGLPEAYDPCAWDFGTGKLDKTARDAFWHFFGAPRGCADMPAYAGAKDFVQRLQDRFDVHFVTAPYDRSKTWMTERRDWLCQMFEGVTPKDVTFTHDKTRVGGHYLIDDKTDNVISWHEKHGGLYAPGPGEGRATFGYLFAQPYNANDLIDGRHRVQTYADVLKKLGA